MNSYKKDFENALEMIEWQNTMLRQQAEKIEALKQIIDANNLSQNIGQFVKPTNEPVAWMSADGKFNKKETWLFPIPLYNHPVKEQDESFDRTASHMAGEYVSYKVELTDEEIGQFKGEWYRNDYASFYDLVRAILRKAQEK